MIQLVSDLTGSEKCVLIQKKAVHYFQHPFTHKGFICAQGWQLCEHGVVMSRADPLVSNGMLLKTCPALLCCVWMHGIHIYKCQGLSLHFQIERKPSFIHAWRIRERISIKESLLLKPFDVRKDKENLAEALEGGNLTGTQVLQAAQPCSLQFKCSKSTIIMHRGIQGINWCFVFAFFFHCTKNLPCSSWIN